VIREQMHVLDKRMVAIEKMQRFLKNI
jgi:hypothetical protein